MADRYDVNTVKQNREALLKAVMDNVPMADAVWAAQDTLERYQDEYVKTAERAVDRLQRSAASVRNPDRGLTDNELGTLQGMATRLEQLDALVALAADHLVAVLRMQRDLLDD